MIRHSAYGHCSDCLFESVEAVTVKKKNALVWQIKLTMNSINGNRKVRSYFQSAVIGVRPVFLLLVWPANYHHTRYDSLCLYVRSFEGNFGCCISCRSGFCYDSKRSLRVPCVLHTLVTVQITRYIVIFD